MNVKTKKVADKPLVIFSEKTGLVLNVCLIGEEGNFYDLAKLIKKGADDWDEEAMRKVIIQLRSLLNGFERAYKKRDHSNSQSS